MLHSCRSCSTYRREITYQKDFSFFGQAMYQAAKPIKKITKWYLPNVTREESPSHFLLFKLDLQSSNSNFYKSSIDGRIGERFIFRNWAESHEAVGLVGTGGRHPGNLNASRWPRYSSLILSFKKLLCSQVSIHVYPRYHLLCLQSAHESLFPSPQVL